nr:hypothetical protein BaRGS_008134 [Batillaria attramentaria]
MWLLAAFAVGVSSQPLSFRLTYNITEGQEPGIFVGSTAVDTGLFSSTDSDDFQLLKFDLFDQGNSRARFFVVDEQSGVIRTNSTIDREAICGNDVDCTIILNLAVYRKTSQTGNFQMYGAVEVVVRIEDVNDNAPEFPQKVVTVQVAENRAPPYKVKTSVASDADKRGENSEIVYTLEDNSGKFALEVENSANGLTELVIVVREMLDRERIDSYYITIVLPTEGRPDCQDNDVNDNGRVVYKLSSRVGPEVLDVYVTVNIVDVNDNAPEIILSLSPEGTDIVEHDPPGKFLGHFFRV